MKAINIFYFFVGLLSFFYARILGMISFGEIMIIIYVTWLVFSRRLSLGKWIGDSQVHTTILLLVLAVFSALIFNLLNGSSDAEIAKYIGTIILLPFSLFFFRDMLMTNDRGILFFILGYGLSTIIVNMYFVQFSDFVVGNRDGDLKQFQEEFYAYTICNLAYIINAFYFKKNIKLLFLLNFLLAILCLMGNSRHLFLMLVIHDFILFLYYYVMKRHVYVTFSKLISWGTILSFILLFTYYGYGFMAESGALGEYGKLKYESQEKEKGGIVSSRSYFVKGLITLTHYPLGGLSNDGRDVNDNLEIRQEYAQIMEIPVPSSKNLMGHSVILNWWIAFGILSVPFWLYIIWLLISCFKYLFNSYDDNVFVALMFYSSLNMLWDIFFSPFGGRIGYGLSIILIIYILSSSKKKMNVFF